MKVMDRNEERRWLVNDFIIQNVSMVLTPCIILSFLGLADSNDNVLISFPNVRAIFQHYDYMLMVRLKPISHSCHDKTEWENSSFPSSDDK